ncbi:hypothetical protein CYMTET_30013 [Cymbomonas tetramitiformis]|uniref:Uncharacterized protein n=1 Tax=Cymbomonas tetramitiformis TaxID=36881 RepID=A0AAE0FJN4_9CHLO|nr:hypothetical protein CYMTET_30013 [Cymbomonas tetramitiformis]
MELTTSAATHSSEICSSAEFWKLTRRYVMWISSDTPLCVLRCRPCVLKAPLTFGQLSRPRRVVRKHLVRKYVVTPSAFFPQRKEISTQRKESSEREKARDSKKEHGDVSSSRHGQPLSAPSAKRLEGNQLSVATIERKLISARPPTWRSRSAKNTIPIVEGAHSRSHQGILTCIEGTQPQRVVSSSTSHSSQVGVVVIFVVLIMKFLRDIFEHIIQRRTTKPAGPRWHSTSTSSSARLTGPPSTPSNLAATLGSPRSAGAARGPVQLTADVGRFTRSSGKQDSGIEIAARSYQTNGPLGAQVSFSGSSQTEDWRSAAPPQSNTTGRARHSDARKESASTAAVHPKSRDPVKTRKPVEAEEPAAERLAQVTAPSCSHCSPPSVFVAAWCRSEA